MDIRGLTGSTGQRPLQGMAHIWGPRVGAATCRPLNPGPSAYLGSVCGHFLHLRDMYAGGFFQICRLSCLAAKQKNLPILG